MKPLEFELQLQCYDSKNKMHVSNDDSYNHERDKNTSYPMVVFLLPRSGENINLPPADVENLRDQLTEWLQSLYKDEPASDSGIVFSSKKGPLPANQTTITKLLEEFDK